MPLHTLPPRRPALPCPAVPGQGVGDAAVPARGAGRGRAHAVRLRGAAAAARGGRKVGAQPGAAPGGWVQGAPVLVVGAVERVQPQVQAHAQNAPGIAATGTRTMAKPPPPPCARRTACARCTATCCAWRPPCTRRTAWSTSWCRVWAPSPTAPRSSAAVRPKALGGRWGGTACSAVAATARAGRAPQALALDAPWPRHGLHTRTRSLPRPTCPSPSRLPLAPSAEEIACIIEREGVAAVLQARSKPMAAVAALLKERDGATRAAALGAIEQAWAEEGDGVFKLLGRCADGLGYGRAGLLPAAEECVARESRVRRRRQSAQCSAAHPQPPLLVPPQTHACCAGWRRGSRTWCRRS